MSRQLNHSLIISYVIIESNKQIKPYFCTWYSIFKRNILRGGKALFFYFLKCSVSRVISNSWCAPLQRPTEMDENTSTGIIDSLQTEMKSLHKRIHVRLHMENVSTHSNSLTVMLLRFFRLISLFWCFF